MKNEDRYRIEAMEPWEWRKVERDDGNFSTTVKENRKTFDMIHNRKGPWM